MSGNRSSYIKLGECGFMIERVSKRDWRLKNTNLKLTERKRIVLCAALMKKEKGYFSFAQDTQGK